MKPYAAGTSDPDQARFNLVLSSSRIKIEHAFGYLVSRWWFLWKHLYLLTDERLAKTIYACCALSNICIDQNDPDFELTGDFQGFEELNNRGENTEINLEDITATADEELNEQDFTDGQQHHRLPTQAQIRRSKRASEARRERIKIDFSRNLE